MLYVESIVINTKIDCESSNALSVGIPVSLEEVLQHKEQRAIFQQKVMDQYPTATLIALKANIPGPIKNNALIACLVEMAREKFKAELTESKFAIIYEKQIDLKSGFDYYAVVNTDNAKEIKELTVQIEDEWTLGRLFDYDVYFENKAISRNDMNLPQRQCLICDNNAKECGRSKKHSLEELRETMIKLIMEEGSVLFR